MIYPKLNSICSRGTINQMDTGFVQGFQRGTSWFKILLYNSGT